MNARELLGVPAAIAFAACLLAPSLAQAVPLPRPRPAHLTAKAAPPAAVKAEPAAAPATIADLTASTAPPAPPASAEPPVAAAPVPPPAPVAVVPAAVEPVPPETATAAPPPAPPLALTPSPPPVEIAAAPVAAVPTQAQTLKRVNTYFNGIRTLVGNFTQVGPDGSKADGKFFLAKPGRVRFYYQRPSTTDIIADGKSLVVRDRKLATQDVYPLSQTPLKFLLDTNLDLSRDSKVVAVYEEPGLISVALEEETSFGGKARVLLVFATQDRQNFELKQWTITDPQGLDTTVAVSELDTSTKPDDKLFKVDYTIYKR